MKIKTIILFLLTAISTLFSQSIDSSALNEKVHGIVYRGNEKYLITNKGYVKVYEEKKKSINDQWTEYYRKAYGDSTLQNPNTIIEQPRLNIPIQFFMPVGGRDWFDNETDFGTEAYLYDFVKVDDNGNYVFRSGVIGIIGKRLARPKK